MTNTAVRDEILIGVDPREQSVPALAWAADEAVRRGLSLRLVLSVPPLHDTQHVDTEPHRTARRARAETALATASEAVRALHPNLPMTTELLDGVPATTVCREAARACMVVLGSRRLSRWEEILSTGSVVVPVSAQAECPVVVVREPEYIAEERPYLVVGVDGSEGSAAAVAFAFEEARLRHAAVWAVWAWHRPFAGLADDTDTAREQQRLLNEFLEPWQRKYPELEVTGDVLLGHPVERLSLASARALAVVVGRRGRGGYTGMRLGSVAHGLLHRAECPVITVPGPRR
ncbi:universal stress protein [Streptomyces sp. NPDC018833]|uniref:universal stress protein n=1 Tax=Streptomyces sp. NPDC018833 TaxID=3365053 RepID=UPI00379D0F0C